MIHVVCVFVVAVTMTGKTVVPVVPKQIQFQVETMESAKIRAALRSGVLHGAAPKSGFLSVGWACGEKQDVYSNGFEGWSDGIQEWVNAADWHGSLSEDKSKRIITKFVDMLEEDVLL